MVRITVGIRLKSFTLRFAVKILLLPLVWCFSVYDLDASLRHLKLIFFLVDKLQYYPVSHSIETTSIREAVYCYISHVHHQHVRSQDRLGKKLEVTWNGIIANDIYVSNTTSLRGVSSTFFLLLVLPHSWQYGSLHMSEFHERNFNGREEKGCADSQILPWGVEYGK